MLIRKRMMLAVLKEKHLKARTMTAARCIENVFGAIGKCYRTGGDEFAVVVFDPEEDRNALSEKLDKEIRRYNRNSSFQSL